MENVGYFGGGGSGGGSGCTGSAGGSTGGTGSNPTGGTGGNNAAGTNTWFCNSTSNCASIAGSAVVVGANGGAGGGSGISASGGSGGSTTGAVGSTKYAGGAGSNSSAGGYVGGAGGGAGGPCGIVVNTGSTITITPDIATAANFEAGTANKLLDASVVFTAETTTTYGATTAFDANTFINTKVTLTGNITTMNCSNFKAGQAGTITFIQDSTGSRTGAFNSGTCASLFRFAGATYPTLTTSASAIDVLSYSCRSSSYCAASLSKGYNP